MINELMSHQKNDASVKELKLNENLLTNSHELSNAFNDHFSTIGTKLANEVPLVTDGSSYADYIVSSKNKFFSVQLVVAIRLNKCISIKGCLVDLTSRSGP